MSRLPWHNMGGGRLATVARKPRGYRIPEDLDQDLELLVEIKKFENKTQAVIHLLREGSVHHLPAEMVARRQAAIAKKVYDREQARQTEQESQRKKAG